MSRKSVLDRSGSILFGLGFVASFLKYAANPVLAALGNLFSLLFYFLGYLSWYIVSQWYPRHPDLEKIAFDLNQFKTQNRLAAFTGMVGVLLAVIAFAFPVLLVPASWIFALSTGFWVYSEFNKQPGSGVDNANFPSRRQKVYLAYAVTMMAMGLLTAISTTLFVCAPALAVTVMIVSTVISLYLIAAAIFLLLEYYRAEIPEQNDSYEFMLSGELKPDQSQELTLDEVPGDVKGEELEDAVEQPLIPSPSPEQSEPRPSGSGKVNDIPRGSAP